MKTKYEKVRKAINKLERAVGKDFDDGLEYAVLTEGLVSELIEKFPDLVSTFLISRLNK